MGRRHSNGGQRDPDDMRNLCGCRGTRAEHRCDEEPEPRGVDTAPWVRRELERLEGPERATFALSIGSLARRLTRAPPP